MIIIFRSWPLVRADLIFLQKINLYFLLTMKSGYLPHIKVFIVGHCNPLVNREWFVIVRLQVTQRNLGKNTCVLKLKSCATSTYSTVLSSCYTFMGEHVEGFEDSSTTCTSILCSSSESINKKCLLLTSRVVLNSLL